VRDRVNGTTERVSVDASGVQANAHCLLPSLSADGRFAAFVSPATNLVTGDTNAVPDIFVRDRLSGTTERVSVAAGGAQANGPSDYPAISADGSCVAFHSTATNLIPSGTNGLYHTFVRDRSNATTQCMSVAGPLTGGGAYPSISDDGRFVGFYSSADDLVANDTNFASDVFLVDRQTGTRERVSVPNGGGQGNSGSMDPAISADGRFVAFASSASNLVTGDTSGVLDIFVRDRQLGTTARVSVSTSGAEGDGSSWYPSISSNGQFVAFESNATTLVAGDTNSVIDAFVHGSPPVLTTFAFCFGDGTGTACPCGNGAPGNGCPSSVNLAGANLSWTGTPSVAADTFTLQGSGMPNSSALYFQGTLQTNGGLGSVFGDGLRCAGGSVIRLGVKINAAGSSHCPAGGDLPISVTGMNSAGNVRTYQIWYRNAAAFCNPEAFNLSNGVQATWSL
jgi:hypothetical protein